MFFENWIWMVRFEHLVRLFLPARFNQLEHTACIATHLYYCMNGFVVSPFKAYGIYAFYHSIHLRWLLPKWLRINWHGIFNEIYLKTMRHMTLQLSDERRMRIPIRSAAKILTYIIIMQSMRSNSCIQIQNQKSVYLRPFAFTFPHPYNAYQSHTQFITTYLAILLRVSRTNICNSRTLKQIEWSSFRDSIACTSQSIYRIDERQTRF